MNAQQARIVKIIAEAVKNYVKDDQRADYPLPADVSVVVKSRKVSSLVRSPYTTRDGSLTVEPVDGLRVRVTAHKFVRCGLWNGPDAIPNNTLRGMLASLYHDLIWVHAAELAAAWGCTELEILRWGGDVLYLVWMWASKDTWWGRREAWLAFQVTDFAAPFYHKLLPRVKKAVGATVLALLCSGCTGCYSLPDGEVESVDGVEVVRQVMADYGNGLGPGPQEKGPSSGDQASEDAE